MTARERMARRDFDRAVRDARQMAALFVQFCDDPPAPTPKGMAEAASDLYLTAGMVVALANRLAHEAQS